MQVQQWIELKRFVPCSSSQNGTWGASARAKRKRDRAREREPAPVTTRTLSFYENQFRAAYPSSMRGWCFCHRRRFLIFITSSLARSSTAKANAIYQPQPVTSRTHFNKRLSSRSLACSSSSFCLYSCDALLRLVCFFCRERSESFYASVYI